MRLYIDREEISDAELKGLIAASYRTFRNPEIAPVVPLDEANSVWLLELFHGPTWAFKDVALKFLGRF